MKNKVLLIGWDAADWEIINPLLDAGLMPTLKKMISEGVSGNINTLDPPLSPMLWTTIATGKRAYDHGILNFTEPRNDPGGQEIRPVTVTSRKVKALWNILTQNDLISNVIGWWPSHPAEPVNGIYVSNFFPKSGSDVNGEVTLIPGCIHPAEMSNAFKELLVEPSEITAELLFPFVPEINNLNDEIKKPIYKIAKILGATASLHAAATYSMEQNDWDFTGVYFDGIDHICHNFMRFHPPQLPFVPDEFYAAYRHVVNATYRFHDMMLERYIELAGKDATVIVMSDHGFLSGNLRQKRLPNEPSSPAYEHRQQGILVMRGAGLKAGEKLYGTSLLDITPTVLQLMGLPVGADMEGRVIHEAFVNPVETTLIPSWETVEGNSGMHNSGMRNNPWAEQIAINQLVELGYIESPSDNLNDRIKTCTNESGYNLAQSYMDGRKPEAASPLLEKLFNENPEQVRYGIKLVQCLLAMQKPDDAEKVLVRIEQSGFNKIYDLEVFHVLIQMNRGNTEQCLRKLPGIISSNEKNHYAHFLLGKCKMKLDRAVEAESHFLKALSLHENNAAYLFGYARCCFALGRYEECIALCMEAIGLNFLIPKAHQLLGEALHEAGKFKEAAAAYELFLSMSSSHAGARQKLIEIYSNHIHEPEKLQVQKKYFENYNGEWIYVVSGLPRSGTSLLMQMMKSGGADLLTDDVRIADNNNSKGYYEYEPVKRISSDATWMKNAQGKVIKVIAQNLFFLPSGYRYKIIFIHRNLQEVLHSQQVMSGRADPAKPFNYPVLLGEAYTNTLQKVSQLPSRHHIEMLEIQHQDLIQKNLDVIEKIKDFTGIQLDTRKMKSAIDDSLYRSRFQVVTENR